MNHSEAGRTYVLYVHIRFPKREAQTKYNLRGVRVEAETSKREAEEGVLGGRKTQRWHCDGPALPAERSECVSLLMSDGGAGPTRTGIAGRVSDAERERTAERADSGQLLLTCIVIRGT